MLLPVPPWVIETLGAARGIRPEDGSAILDLLVLGPLKPLLIILEAHWFSPRWRDPNKHLGHRV